jgi:two-component system CheB/CheR fusion protein
VYIELLAKAVEDLEDGDAIRRMTAQALASVRRLGEQITELMDVQRLQSGKLPIELAPIDIGNVTEQMVTLARVLTKDLPIELDNAAGSLIVNADRRRIEQVLLNLLTNAITYASSSDHLDVRLRREDGLAVIEVQDYGPGIPAADVPRLFSRYFQVERQQSSGTRGLGLGLYIAREIVTAHGGTLDVITGEGKGSTFIVRLPIAPSSAPAAPAPSPVQ